MTRQPLVIGGLTFLCEDPYETARAQTLYTKEPGTIAWLRATLQPGDVFYDIGANIGCYSLVAAQLVGDTGHVYAFEPHLFNAASLLRNIAANHFTDRITVVTSPLEKDGGLRAFHYASLRAGSSGHQLGQPISETGKAFTPAVSVLTHSRCLDDLLYRLRPPTVIKLDVDGLERAILHGMLGHFTDRAVRAVQVEMHPPDRDAITEYLASVGYQLASRHYTHAGQHAVDAGADPDSVTDNAIFARVTSAALPGQSAMAIDGLHLWEPTITLQRTKPDCGCDDTVRPAWTFADSRDVGGGSRQTFCRKCGRAGATWSPT